MALDPLDLIPEFAFWRDGCRTMAENICKLLRLAGEPVTRERIVAFLSTLPRRPNDLASELWQNGYCFACLEKAQDNMPPEDRGTQELGLGGYFLCYFVDRSYLRQALVIDAFLVILGGLTLDGEKG